MRFSPASMLSFLKREPEAQDAFGGEDLFDGEPRPTNWGPKIALAASVVMFLALAGGIGAMIMLGAEPPPAAGGSLADLEVIEEDPAAPAPTAEAAPERDAQRRPWLQAAGGPAEPEARLGMSDIPTEAPAPAAATPTETAPAPELMAPPAATAPAAAPAPTQQTARPASASDLLASIRQAAPAPTAAPEPAAETPPADTPAPAAADSMTAPMPVETAAAPEPQAQEAEPQTAEPQQPEPAATPSLLDPGVAPGAPERFVASAEDANPAIAGGRPRLSEPALPPTDNTSVAAPPPRFANLAEVKSAAPTPVPTATPAKVAVVVHGLGLSQQATEAAISKLPPSVTLAFSPYARDLKKWVEAAKARGHEVLIEVPMEGKQFPATDPGPLGLLTSLSAKENQDRMDTILKEAAGTVGVIDVVGSKFRESEPHITEVFAKLQQQSLFYVQGEPGVRVGEATVPTATADVVLDERPFRAAIDARLDYAERLARYQGSAVAVLSPKPVSYERLVLWLDQAIKKGVAITPVSQVLIR